MKLITQIFQKSSILKKIDAYLLSQPKKLHLCRLFERYGLPVPRYFIGWTDTGGGDHGGDPWTISVNTEVAGNHTNVGAFTVNNGITATVKAWDGASYGTFEVHATSVNVIGTITASGKGFGGGGAGGGGGGDGSSEKKGIGGAGGAGVAGGVAGSTGLSDPGGDYSNGGRGGAGGAGGGSYGGAGGAYGAGGIANAGGAGGNGVVGSVGTRGGYATAAGQGDTSVDESLLKGSGGGGAGGGGGGGMASGFHAGGGGGAGGAANRGGGWIKLYASGSLTVSGAIYSKGLDNSAGDGTVGGAGSETNRGGDGGIGGSAAVSEDSNGAAGGAGDGDGGDGGAGEEGGYGAGGGVLLKCGADGMDLDGTIDVRGGNTATDNGGTIKVFYYDDSDITYTHYEGRHYTKIIGETFSKTLGFVPSQISAISGLKILYLGATPSFVLGPRHLYHTLYLGLTPSHISTVSGLKTLYLGLTPSHISTITGLKTLCLGLTSIHISTIYKFILELWFYNRSGTLVKVLSSKAQNFPLVEPGLDFKFARDGGCGLFKFTVSEDLNLEYNYRCDIYLYGTKWYSGYLTELPQVGTGLTYKYEGWGFFEQVDWQTINKTYTGDDIGVIVEDIVDTYIIPNTDIIKGTT